MAKAILFSDLHESYKQLYNLETFLKKNPEIKIAIFAGDFLNMGEPVGFVNPFMRVFDENKVRLLWVPGNNDFGPAYFKLRSRYPSLEGRVVEVEKKIFSGVGGSPASWEGQYAGEKMIDIVSIAQTIFVSHIPPPGLFNYQKNDIDSPLLNKKNSDSPGQIDIENTKMQPRSSCSNSQHTTSKYASPLSRKHFSNAPLVHICGHIHSQWGCAILGQTKLVKLAPLENGHYVIMDLDDLSVEFRRFQMNKYNFED
ncbi:MAG: metallophosphoesterase [bacterium]